MATSQTTSLVAKMVNILVCPAEVFDEVLAAPRQLSTWLLPTVAAALASLFLLLVTTVSSQMTTPPDNGIEGPGISATDSVLSNRPLSALLVCGSTLAGTLWSAVVLWVIARFFLKRVISFSKTLEVVGLAGTVFALGALITALLVLAVGDPNCRPALSLLTPKLAAPSPLHAVLEIFNVFYVWSCVVLAIGLSRLTAVSFKEASFWVFAYWFLLRISLILLG